MPSEVASFPDGAFTLEGWICADSYAGRRAFLAKTEQSEFGIFVTGGVPDFSVIRFDPVVLLSFSIEFR